MKVSLLVTALGVRPRLGWCASRAAHVCELNDVFFYVYVCDFFTLYSKQINNYNLSFTYLFACECVCVVAFIGIFVVFCFCFLEARPPAGSYRTGGVQKLVLY